VVTVTTSTTNPSIITSSVERTSNRDGGKLRSHENVVENTMEPFREQSKDTGVDSLPNIEYDAAASNYLEITTRVLPLFNLKPYGDQRLLVSEV